MVVVEAHAATPPPRIRRGHVAVVCLLLVIFAFDALVQLNELLRGMHVAGQPAMGVSDLASRAPEKAVAVWEAHGLAEDREGYAGYEIVFFIHFVVDCAFALALGLLLFVTAGFARGVDRARTLAQVAAMTYLLADLLENVAGALVVYDRASVGGLILPLAIAKWLALVVAAVVIAGQALAVWRSQLPRVRVEIRQLFHLLRVLVIVAPVFALALLAHPQIPDLIRAWTPFRLLTAFVLALFLALTVWVIARQLIGSGKPWKPLRNQWVVVSIIGAAALVQVAASAIVWFGGDDRTWHFGWGLLIPAGIALLGALFGAIFGGGSHVEYEHRLGAWTQMLPALLAAFVIVGLGLGALRASFGESVFTGELWHWRGVITGWDEQLHPLVLIGFALLMPITAWFVFWILSRRPVWIPPEKRAIRRVPFPREPRLIEPANAERPRGIDWRLRLLGVLVAEAAVFYVMWGNVHGFTEAVGGVAVLATFLIFLAMLAGAIVWVSDAVAYPAALPGRTSPVILILVAWFLIAAQLDREGQHGLRVLPAEQQADGPRLGQAWACWLIKNGLEPGPHRLCPFEPGQFTYRTEEPEAAIPLISVATSGGATRAAYWTSTVLDCVLEVLGEEASCTDEDERVAPGDFRRSNALFALSGISGGSVGLASYAAHLAERADIGTHGAWIDQRLDRDFLSPTVGWMLFVEFPQSFLRFRHPVDSAEVLERSWEHAWGEAKARGDWRLFELWRTHHSVPLLLLNGTSVEDGCRFNGSVLDASVETLLIRKDVPSVRRFHDCRATGPFDDVERLNATEQLLPKTVLGATRDLTDFLCNRKLDAPLATVAILSARFPYVSPSGRVERRCADEDQGNKVTYVVDGGYLETSGASPLVELQDKLGPIIRDYNRRPHRRACVIPFMIQIDNGYEDDAAARATKRPVELFVPPLTLLATRGARAAQAKAQAALLFDRPFGRAELDGDLLADRYTHFVIQTHAGAKAPLGWALSQTARNALRDQLTQPKNAAALREVRDWLRPGALACPPVPTSQ